MESSEKNCDSQDVPVYLIFLDDNTRLSKEQKEELSRWWSKMELTKLMFPDDTPKNSPSDPDFSALNLRTDYCNWSDPLGVEAVNVKSV